MLITLEVPVKSSLSEVALVVELTGARKNVFCSEPLRGRAESSHI